MKHRTDFWEWYEQLYRTPQVIRRDGKTSDFESENTGSIPVSLAKKYGSQILKGEAANPVNQADLEATKAP